MADVTVIGIGCELDRLFAEQPGALAVPVPPRADDLRDLWELVAGPLRGGAAVIVVVGGWLPAAALHSVRTVRSLLDTDRVAVHVTEMPPLAASVTCALLAALAPAASSAGSLASAIEKLEATLHVLATSGSVARLSHPGVTLAHHVRSLVPGKAFGIGLQPEQFVLALGHPAEDLPLGPSGHEIQLLAAAAENGELGWLANVVSPALGDVGVRVLEPTIYGADWWGSSRLVEIVGVPTDLEWLATTVLGGEPRPCGWCGEPIHGSRCPFCGQWPDALRDRAAVGAAHNANHAMTEAG
jgi:hypothetical protein